MSRHGLWQTLGIDRTDDKAAIRKAYGEALRAMDPDADPDGFARLRAARDQALAMAQAGGIDPPLQPEDDAPKDSGAISPLDGQAFVAPLLDGAPPGTLSPSASSPSPQPVSIGRSDGGTGTDVELPDLVVGPPVIHAVRDGDVAILAPATTAPYDAAYNDLLRLLHGEDAAGLTAEEVERLRALVTFLLADPRMGRLDFTEDSERWFAGVLAGAIPRSDPVLAQVSDRFGWATQIGTIEASPQKERVAERARSLAYVDAVQNPGHTDHRLWSELGRPVEIGSRRGWFIGKKRMHQYLGTLRGQYPDAEDWLDPARVALWEQAQPVSGPNWWVWAIGISVLLRICALLIPNHGSTPAPTPTTFLEAPYALAENREKVMNLALLSFADGFTLAKVHEKNPALEKELDTLWDDAVRRSLPIESFLETSERLLNRRFRVSFARASYDEAVAWRRAELAELEAARAKGVAACGEWMSRLRTIDARRSPDEVQRRRRAMAAVILADPRPVTEADVVPETYTIPGKVMTRLSRETGLDRKKLNEALDFGGTLDARCKTRRALLTTALDLPHKTALPILRGM